ncbi:YadA-like family protein [Burkholderia sp. Ac-20392]|uniref:YadA family autotransporter adhesin n=1 Tax=Burkholderia sp. Ac-20392 TaxID=2703905 RepID=UPI003216A171
MTSLSTSTSSGLGSLSTSISSVTVNTTNLGTSTAEALGGGATYDPATGKITAPSYVTYNNDGTTTTNGSVGDAIDNLNAKGAKYFHANSTEADSQATGANSVAIGPNAIANLDNSVAIGHRSVTGAAVGVSSSTIGDLHFGGYAGANPFGVFSVGAPGQERQIQNVAAGRVSTDSTDAINGSQLHATNLNVASLSTGLSSTNSNLASLSTSTSTSIGSLSTGLSSTNEALGSLSTSTSTSVTSLSTGLSTTNDRVSSLSTSVTNINTQINNLSTSASRNTGITADMNGSGTDAPTVTAGSNSVAIGAKSDDGGRSNVVSVGSAEQQRQIVNVAPGTQGTDAVNVNQLTMATESANRYTDQRVGAIQQGVNDLARNAYSGIAIAGALAGMPQVDPGKVISVGAGFGNYGGYTAIAVGGSARIAQNTVIKLGVGTVNGSRMMVNGGIGHSW